VNLDCAAYYFAVYYSAEFCLSWAPPNRRNLSSHQSSAMQICILQYDMIIIYSIANELQRGQHLICIPSWTAIACAKPVCYMPDCQCSVCATCDHYVTSDTLDLCSLMSVALLGCCTQSCSPKEMILLSWCSVSLYVAYADLWLRLDVKLNKYLDTLSPCSTGLH